MEMLGSCFSFVAVPLDGPVTLHSLFVPGQISEESARAQKMFQEAKDELLRDLEMQVRQKGGNAMVGFSLQVNKLDGYYLLLQAQSISVIIKEMPWTVNTVLQPPIVKAEPNPILVQDPPQKPMMMDIPQAAARPVPSLPVTNRSDLTDPLTKLAEDTEQSIRVASEQWKDLKTVFKDGNKELRPDDIGGEHQMEWLGSLAMHELKPSSEGDIAHIQKKQRQGK